MTEGQSPSAALADALANLTRTIAEPGADLADSVALLADACRVAVDSYVGLSVRATVNASELGFTTLSGVPRIAASLRLTMTARSWPADAGPIVLIFYGSTAGAFVDLCADLTWLLASTPNRVAVDEDLSPPTFRPVGVVLAKASSVDQATGVLIASGDTAEQAIWRLTDLAERSGRSLDAEADYLLSSLDAVPTIADEDIP